VINHNEPCSRYIPAPTIKIIIHAVAPTVPAFLVMTVRIWAEQHAAVGAVATIFVGFSWGGWSLGSTADRMAKEQSERAVVAALAPVCADKFRALPDGEAKTIALSKVEAWKRGEEFPKDFVTLPGETYPSSALVYACSTLLLAPKSAALQ
jgi:hypothetical protein